MKQDWAAAQTAFLTGDRAKDARNVAILLDTVAAVTANADLDSLKRSIVDKAIAVTNAERGLLLLKDEESGQLKIEVARDKMGNALPAGLKYSQSIPKKVFETGKAETLMDAAGGSDVALGQSILDLRLVSVMCGPLTTQEETLGVLYVDSKASAQGFTKGDLELFTTLGSQCGLAIQNAKLVEAYLEQQRLQHDLYVAKEIQQGMLPRTVIERPRMEIAGVNLPCEETGGDYFDYIRAPNGHIGLVVGDVSGHGIGAALFMATARALLRAFVSSHPDLASVFNKLNNSLERDMGTGRFMTLFYGDLDPRENLVRYIRAGHNEPLLYRAARDEFEELSGPGMGLGILRDYEYRVSEPISLEEGDVLLMFTDGIPEARNPESEGKEQFGMDRLMSVIRSKRSRSAREIVESIVREVTEFVGQDSFEDDLTLIVVKVLEP